MNIVLILVVVLGFVNTCCVSAYVMKNFRRHIARVAYDGANFKGFQEQESNIRTVQQTLREIFSKRCNRRVNIIGASRTDAGVHAKGQAIHFECEDLTDIASFENSINVMLPNDVKIYDLTVAPLNASGNPIHACGSATHKFYKYSFCNSRYTDPLKARYCTAMGKRLDFDLFNRSLQMYVGTHDFKAFGNKVDKVQADYDEDGKGMEHITIRTVDSIKLNDLGGGYFDIDFHLHSALHKMIRNMVGTSWAVAGGTISLAEQESYLREALHRNMNKGNAAPPQGLCLERVFYDNY